MCSDKWLSMRKTFSTTTIKNEEVWLCRVCGTIYANWEELHRHLTKSRIHVERLETMYLLRSIKSIPSGGRKFCIERTARVRVLCVKCGHRMLFMLPQAPLTWNVWACSSCGAEIKMDPDTRCDLK